MFANDCTDFMEEIFCLSSTYINFLQLLGEHFLRWPHFTLPTIFLIAC